MPSPQEQIEKLEEERRRQASPLNGPPTWLSCTALGGLFIGMASFIALYEFLAVGGLLLYVTTIIGLSLGGYGIYRTREHERATSSEIQWINKEIERLTNQPSQEEQEAQRQRLIKKMRSHREE